MTKVAIAPVFKIHPDRYEAFLRRVIRQRDDCLANEPGCLHFDVLTVGDGETVMLYEIYSNDEALETHRTYPHYKSFKADTEAMVRSLELQKLTLVD